MSKDESFRVLLGRLDERTEGMCQKIDKIDETIHGNGGDGLILKVDRNTQSRRSWRRFIPTLIALIAATAAIVSVIIQYRKELP